MPITNGYATLEELKARLGISDTVDDSVLEQNIEAASRVIDQECNRVFYKTAGQTRYYTAADAYTVFIEDLLALTTLTTDQTGSRDYPTTWAATDYDLEPYTGPPYTRIARAPLGVYTFPRLPRSVKVVGDFGYCATGSHPAPVREACLILAGRYFKRKDAPFGIAGHPDTGVMRLPAIDPDLRPLLQQFIRFDAMA